MSDATVLANARRQAELEAQHRDLTQPVPPVGTDGDSIRRVKGFEQITDEMLQERATFNLKDHMANMNAIAARSSIDLTKMTADELRGLAEAAVTELGRKEKD